ncbi:SDR family NAD(P)-dependent oxidoreductase [Rhizobium sp. Root1203]|uniref:SDR family NAD(P)-dependent oxidoreductase n=1 Tax=Rhizobium sp. Root1203 TaxID=1736427 RepID=UPI003FD4A2AC
MERDEQLWDRIVGVNLEGTWMASRALLPSILEGHHGAIVNIASISSFTANGAERFTPPPNMGSSA